MILTISLEDLNELDRINKELVTAPLENRWAYQTRLIRFFDKHPTLIPYLTEAARDKKRTKIEADKELGTFTSLHAGGRR